MTLWCCEPQHDFERYVLAPNELKIPRVIVDVQVAEPAGGCIGYMIGNRRRDINTLPTGELCPEIKIGVFVVKKEILVQEADLVDMARLAGLVWLVGCDGGKTTEAYLGFLKCRR